MTIIGIISVGVYGSYISIIKTTKASEKKQVALNAGNKIIERIKEVADGGKINSTDTIINLDNYLKLNGNLDNFSGKKLLNSDGSDNIKGDYKYKAEVDLSRDILSLDVGSKIGCLYNVTVAIKDSNNNVLFNEKYSQIIKIN